MKMKKSVKRICSMVTALLLCMCTLTPSAAALQVEDVSLPDVLVGEEAVSEELRAELEENGIQFNAETQVRLIAPVSQGRSADSSGNALIITNTDGESLTTSAVLFYNDSGLMSFEHAENGKARGSQRYDFPLNDKTRKYVVYATAYFDAYNSDKRPLSTGQGARYVRPLDLQVFVQKNNPCTIEQITVEYITCGFECTYPGFVTIGGDWDYVDWNMKVSEEFVSVNTVYQDRNPYYSDRVIDIFGGVVVGHMLDIRVIVDGKSVGERFDISQGYTPIN